MPTKLTNELLYKYSSASISKGEDIMWLGRLKKNGRHALHDGRWKTVAVD
jgi:hypothetical protein